MVGGPSRRSGNGQRTFPYVQNWSGTLPEVRKWSGDHLKGPEVVGGPTWRSKSGWGTFGETWKWSGNLLGGPKVVRAPS